jgi:putative methyltransferase (TIGR04325 family)
MWEIKKFLKVLIPPIVVSIFRLSRKQRKATEIWSGNYSSWNEAQFSCTGYDSSPILEKCKNSLLKVKKGEAVYERDSVLFDKIQYSLGLLVGLQRTALGNDGKLCVLDFGGSLGSTYYQNKEILSSLKELKWCIVEQTHFVDCGKKYFEDEQLKFYVNIEDCLAKHKPNVLLISGVLQYLENPYEWIEKFVALGITNIIIDRTSFVESEMDIITVQNVPDSIYEASYPAWFFNKAKFMSKLTKQYNLIFEFDSKYTDPIKLNNIKAYWSGFVLEENSEK